MASDMVATAGHQLGKLANNSALTPPLKKRGKLANSIFSLT